MIYILLYFEYLYDEIAVTKILNQPVYNNRY